MNKTLTDEQALKILKRFFDRPSTLGGMTAKQVANRIPLHVRNRLCRRGYLVVVILDATFSPRRRYYMSEKGAELIRWTLGEKA